MLIYVKPSSTKDITRRTGQKGRGTRPTMSLEGMEDKSIETMGNPLTMNIMKEIQSFKHNLHTEMDDMQTAIKNVQLKQ